MCNVLNKVLNERRHHHFSLLIDSVQYGTQLLTEYRGEIRRVAPQPAECWCRWDGIGKAPLRLGVDTSASTVQYQQKYAGAVGVEHPP